MKRPKEPRFGFASMPTLVLMLFAYGHSSETGD
jgi:hypothetical protein